jgi:hypothetical protein
MFLVVRERSLLLLLELFRDNFSWIVPLVVRRLQQEPDMAIRVIIVETFPQMLLSLTSQQQQQQQQQAAAASTLVSQLYESLNSSASFDPSGKVRIACLRVLQSAVVENTDLVWSIVNLRCRDKDAGVRVIAFSMLRQLLTDVDAQNRRKWTISELRAMMAVGLSDKNATIQEVTNELCN